MGICFQFLGYHLCDAETEFVKFRGAGIIKKHKGVKGVDNNCIGRYQDRGRELFLLNGDSLFLIESEVNAAGDLALHIGLDLSLGVLKCSVIVYCFPHLLLDAEIHLIFK